MRQTLEVTNIEEDSAYNCGFQYGSIFQPMIAGFLGLQNKPSARDNNYAKKCWKEIKNNAPLSADFISGVSKGSCVSVELLTLNLLKEKISNPFSTFFALSNNWNTIVGQNWNRPARYYPWPGLLKMRLNGGLKTATYHYPGIWSVFGVNEAGLALAQSSVNMRQKKRIIGVPSYVLSAEILQSAKSTGEAVQYLTKTNKADCFTFVIGDCNGDFRVIEYSGDELKVEKGNFLVLKSSNQDKDALKILGNSRKGDFHIAKILSALRDKKLRQESEDHMTIDSLAIVCQEKILYTFRGGRETGLWQDIHA